MGHILLQRLFIDEKPVKRVGFVFKGVYSTCWCAYLSITSNFRGAIFSESNVNIRYRSAVAPQSVGISHWACMAFRLCHCAIILYTPSSIFTVDYLFFIMYHLTYIVQVKNVNTCNIFGFFWSYIIREVTMTQWECYSIAKYGMWAEFEPLRPLATSVALF